MTRVIDRNAAGRIATAAERFAPEAIEPLARDLKAAVRGDVDFSPGARALYATDASNYRQAPLGVVTPRDVDDALAAIGVCARHNAPITPRGGGTALAGQTCNTAVVIDFSRHLDRILELDPQNRRARVEPGCILDCLRDAAEEHGLTFGPDPATHDHNTLGGMIGNDSCGVHSVMAGRTSHNVEWLKVVTYDGLVMDVGPTPEPELRAIIAAGGRRGEIYRRMVELRDRYAEAIRARWPRLPRLVSGFANIDALLPENGFNVARALVGTEAACVTVLEATVKLAPSPPCRVLAIVAFDDIYAAADAVPRVLEAGPVGLEGMDDLLAGYVRRKHLHEEGLECLPEGGGWLIVEFGGDTRAEAADKARALERMLRANRIRILEEPAEQQKIWAVRESGLGATAFVPDHPDTWPGWEDSAVPRDRLGAYLRELKGLMARFGYEASVYGHFGDGLIHCRIPFELTTEEGIARWRAFMDEAADLVVAHGGSLSGEHGDGQARAALLEKMYGPDFVRMFAEFKAIWDPGGKMNPGKAIDAYPLESNLRLAPPHTEPTLDTAFRYADDHGSFARAMTRCVGVGKCRRLDPGEEVMCPSFIATRDEKHSTRGRARLLFEMLRGETVTDGFDSAEVEEALNLCLACKGCRKDCPVEVDMATYKAEFRYRHYAHRRRPRHAWAMGFLHRWAPLAEAAPWAANFGTHAPGISRIAKWAVGFAPQAQAPRFASRSFRRQFARHTASGGRERVVLWADTFNNYFRPDTAMAAVKVLEAMGCEVVVPKQRLCCGRPLYDWGFLDETRRLWRRTLDALEDEVAAGTPVIGLEPACLSAFKDELPGLMGDDPRAEKLADAAVYFADFVEARADRLPDLRTGGAALWQPHCHHHAVLGAQAQQRLFERLELDIDHPKQGCCGMAGAFGFAADTAALAREIGEYRLLPAVRAAPAETAILADGFSCREQIRHGSGREALHLAEVLADRF